MLRANEESTDRWIRSEMDPNHTTIHIEGYERTRRLDPWLDGSQAETIRERHWERDIDLHPRDDFDDEKYSGGISSQELGGQESGYSVPNHGDVEWLNNSLQWSLNRVENARHNRPKAKLPTDVATAVSEEDRQSAAKFYKEIKKSSNIITSQHDILNRLKAYKEKRLQTELNIQSLDFPERRQKIVDSSKEVAQVALQFAKDEEFEDAHFGLGIAEAFLDLATSAVPGISWARDIYETVSGTDLISGSDLSETERTIVAVGALSGGLLSKMGKLAKITEKVGKGLCSGRIISKGKKFFDSAKEITSKLSPGEIKTYLSNVDQVPRQSLIKDMELIGLKVKGGKTDRPFLEFIDHKGRVRAKIHPPDKVGTPYHHLHIYDQNGTPLNGVLGKLTGKKGHKSPDAHIPIKEP